MVDLKSRLLVEPIAAHPLQAAEAEFAEVSELVRQKKESLAEVERKIAALQAQFEETNTRKEELARQVEDCSNKLERAQTLIGGLGGERGCG